MGWSAGRGNARGVLVWSFFAAPGGEPKQLPVRRAVTGSAKTSWIDDGFREVNRVAIHPVPIL
jgi:hypothetical protein